MQQMCGDVSSGESKDFSNVVSGGFHRGGKIGSAYTATASCSVDSAEQSGRWHTVGSEVTYTRE